MRTQMRKRRRRRAWWSYTQTLQGSRIGCLNFEVRVHTANIRQTRRRSPAPAPARARAHAALRLVDA